MLNGLHLGIFWNIVAFVMQNMEVYSSSRLGCWLSTRSKWFEKGNGVISCVIEWGKESFVIFIFFPVGGLSEYSCVKIFQIAINYIITYASVVTSS